MSLADLQGMFSVNVVGLIACTKEVIPVMKERRSGHIINIASQAGKTGNSEIKCLFGNKACSAWLYKQLADGAC